MSWDDLDSLVNNGEIVDHKRDDLARLCLRVFSTEDGQKLMSWLRHTYVDVPIAVPGADASFAYFNDGQRTVVRDLIVRIIYARSL